MALFYLPEIEYDSVDLEEEETHHIARVMRLQEGDPIELTDGRGLYCECEIVKIGKKTITVRVLKRHHEFEKRDYSIHVAIAPTKNIDRFEWFLEKATEIGIDEITPVQCQNSERNVIRTDRMEKKIISAMKQSIKAYKPALHRLESFEEFIEKSESFNQLYIGYCGNVERELLSHIYQKGENAVIMIGPEGDFTRDEINMALRRNYRPVSLGESRLRTETAGIVACHTLYLLNH